MEKAYKKKPNILVRLLLFCIALVIVLAAFHDQLNMDSLRRWFTYRDLTLNDNGQAESFRYSGSPDDVFANLDGDFLVCSNNTISLYSDSGTKYIDQPVSISTPALDISGGSAAVYDAGGHSIYVLRQRQLAFHLECTGNILSAHLNSNDLLTVVSQESGYRGVVTVYDPHGEIKAALRLSSAYVMEATLADDGTTLSVVTIGQQGGTFSSTLSIYDLSAALPDQVSYDVSPISSTDLGRSVILSLDQEVGAIWALGDQGLSVLNYTGTLLGMVDWSDRYLKNYTLSNHGFAVIQLGQHRTGSQGELHVVDKDGTLLGNMLLEAQVLSLDAAGRYFAVLTADRLDIYTKDLTLYSSLSSTQNARKVLLRDDGSAILISVGSARLYVPS